jgi:hypothetical protein
MVKHYGGKPVRIRVRDGEPWFNERDLTARLRHVDGHKAVLENVEEFDRLPLQIGGKVGRSSIYINKSGLYDAYRLILWVISRVGIWVVRTIQTSRSITLSSIFFGLSSAEQPGPVERPSIGPGTLRASRQPKAVPGDALART